MSPLQKLTLRDFQNLMNVVENGYSMQKFGAIIGRAGSTVNRMIGILLDLEFISRNSHMNNKNKTFKVLRNELNYEELKEYIGSSIVERQRVPGDKVNDNLELQFLPHKTISLNLIGTVSVVNYGF